MQTVRVSGGMEMENGRRWERKSTRINDYNTPPLSIDFMFYESQIFCLTVTEDTLNSLEQIENPRFSQQYLNLIARK